jgi:succinoglycan biosynthesis transport protein ExoP
MTNQSEGERMFNLNPANLPDSPSFPNRWRFAGGGLGAGLALGLGLALWLELRDQSIRTEADAEAALELPLLAAVPWVGVVAPENGDGKLKFWNRNKNPDPLKDRVGV